MIYFDKKTLNLLRYINQHPGVSEPTIRSKFSEYGSALLISLVQEDYLLAKDDVGNWCRFDSIPYRTTESFTYYATPKGKQLIETTCFNFWKWIIPTIISIISLVISIITSIMAN